MPSASKRTAGPSWSRGRALIAALASVPLIAPLAGCGADDVELNGKIFDAVGVSPSTKTSAREPKMVARAPLVIPPGLEKLPAPGAQPGAESAEVAALADPDRVAATNQAELERQQAEYCKKHYEFAKAHGDAEADSAAGPLGPCRGSFLSSVKKFGGIGMSSEDDVQPGQVEN